MGVCRSTTGTNRRMQRWPSGRSEADIAFLLAPGSARQPRAPPWGPFSFGGILWHLCVGLRLEGAPACMPLEVLLFFPFWPGKQLDTRKDFQVVLNPRGTEWGQGELRHISVTSPVPCWVLVPQSQDWPQGTPSPPNWRGQCRGQGALPSPLPRAGLFLLIYPAPARLSVCSEFS